MIRKISVLAAAFAFAFTTLAAPVADARDRRGGYYERDHRDYDRRRHHYRDHDDDSDALAAGAIGLVLGLAIGSLASQPSEPRARCSDDYQRCAPPSGYYDRGYRDQGYDPRYDDRSAYEEDYGYDAPPRAERCTQRLWDRATSRYVYVDVPC